MISNNLNLKGKVNFYLTVDKKFVINNTSEYDMIFDC